MAVEKDIVPGLAIEGFPSISLQQLIDFLSKASVAENKALIIHDYSTPDVASNPRYARFLWHNLNDHTLNYYNGASWVALSLGSITVVAQINDNTITLAKLAQGEGNLGDVLRKDPSTGTVKWMAPVTLFTTNIVPLNAIDHSGASDRPFLRYLNGSVIWDTVTNVKAELGIGAGVPTPNLNPAIFRVPKGSFAYAWVSDNAFFNSIADAIIPVSKISNSGSNGQVIKLVSGKAAWADNVTQQLRLVTYDFYYDDGSGPGFPYQTGDITRAVSTAYHGFYDFNLTDAAADIPKLVQVMIVFDTDTADYLTGEEIPIENLMIGQDPVEWIVEPMQWRVAHSWVQKISALLYRVHFTIQNHKQAINYYYRLLSRTDATGTKGFSVMSPANCHIRFKIYY